MSCTRREGDKYVSIILGESSGNLVTAIRHSAAKKVEMLAKITSIEKN